MTTINTCPPPALSTSSFSQPPEKDKKAVTSVYQIMKTDDEQNPEVIVKLHDKTRSVATYVYPKKTPLNNQTPLKSSAPRSTTQVASDVGNRVINAMTPSLVAGMASARNALASAMRANPDELRRILGPEMHAAYTMNLLTGNPI